MELSVLNSVFRRETLIENWSSLVWTERFSSAGEFQLVSNNIADILEKLPIPGPLDPPLLVCIDDSEVPMIVLDHNIEEPYNEPPKITTTGKVFETALDRRITIRNVISGEPRDTEWRVEGAASAAIAAYEVMESIIVDGTPTPEDIIPEIALFNSVADSGDTLDYVVEPKDLYSWVLETLALGKYGLKSQLYPLEDKIALIIYKGTDRSGEDGVVFDVALDQFTKSNYLLTQSGYKNVMITSTQNGQEFATLLDDMPSGLARRVAWQDLSSEITLDGDNVALPPLTINKGKVALADLSPLALFSGSVSEQASQGYGSEYFLGDIVKLQGDYGLDQNARVAEFIRTEDSTGFKAYPTFEAVSP